MKITLVFNEEEKEDAELAMKARSIHAILAELDSDLRNKIKYHELSEDTEKAYQEVRDLIRELLTHGNIPF